MAKVGYARTSTIEQEAGLEAQLRDLKAYGCEEIFYEHASAVRKRDELEKALIYVRKGDEFIVSKIDRLARSVSDFLKIHESLKQKGVLLKILSLPFDISTPQGIMMITMLASFAEMERNMMLERQREGIIKAKKEGKFTGRKPLPSQIKETVINYAKTGVSKRWIAEKLSIGEASVYRILKETKEPTL